MTRGFDIVQHADAAAFLARAESWLAAREAEHNLLLGIAGRLRDGANPYDDPISLITVESGAEVVGCAWRTPPYNLGLTRMPAAAIAPLLDAVAAVHPELPGMVGPREVVTAAGERWAAPRGLGVRTAVDLRIYENDAVLAPSAPPPGRYRPAAPADAERLVGWAVAFQREAVPGEPPRLDLLPAVERMIAAGTLAVWEDGEPVSMAAATSPTPSGVRVNWVYTPPALRGRGYASACVAALSRAQLDAGRRFCFLYTDLANPTSNSIYAKIGYRPVCDALQIAFVP